MSTDAYRIPEPEGQGQIMKKPRELTWPILLSTDAEHDFALLIEEFEEFGTTFRNVIGQVIADPKFELFKRRSCLNNAFNRLG